MATVSILASANQKGGSSGSGEIGIRVAQITMSNSYTTNGEAVVPSDLQLHGIDIMLFDNPPGYVCAYDDVNRKVQVFRQRDPAAAGGADIPLPEVANAVDLSALQLKAFVVGRP